MKEFAVFWGCTIPARFPFIEKATRLVFDDLGANVHELEGHTCCPEGVLVKANDEDAFYTDGRAQPRDRREGRPRRGDAVQRLLLHVQGGPRATSRRTGARASAINERLAPRGPALRRRPRHHALRRVARRRPRAGARRLARCKKPLWGMRSPSTTAATCCARSPPCAGTTRSHPTKVEELVAALGARVVDYTTKMQCCGGALDRVGEREGSLAFARRKLMDVQDEGVDALVVVCPSCFQQFDLNQAALQRAKEDVNVPVFYLSELIALAYGSRARGDRPRHAPRVGRAVPRQVGGSARPTRRGSPRYFDVSLLAKCDACQACKDDCPVCKVDPTFQPTEIIERARATASSTTCSPRAQLWKCLECYTCQEMCHSRHRHGRRRSASSRSSRWRPAHGPESGRGGLRHVPARPACSASRRSRARKKLGLEPLPATGGDVARPPARRRRGRGR